MTAAPDVTGLQPGFRSPVADSQRVFRAILVAMSDPGSQHGVPIDLAPPPVLGRTAAAICLALLDYETPVWLDEATGDDEARAYLRFHCGCPLVAGPDQARFAVIGDVADMPLFTEFAWGSEAYPDESATLIFRVESLCGGPEVRLSGPGIREGRTFAPKGILPTLWNRRREMEAVFPLGLDLIFAANSGIAAVPRSSNVTF